MEAQAISSVCASVPLNPVQSFHIQHPATGCHHELPGRRLTAVARFASAFGVRASCRHIKGSADPYVTGQRGLK